MQHPTSERPSVISDIEKSIFLHGFHLSDTFLARYRGAQPDWGPVGYVTFKSKYAARLDPSRRDSPTEEWDQALERVVNGTYSVQRWHCQRHRLLWDEGKAQASAQRMFEIFWNFRGLPPGRGLFMMGRPFVARAGGAALNNCGFVSTQHVDQDLADPFCWLMEMSMLGVGVGFDTRGAGKVLVVRPSVSEETHVVTDDREGWVGLVRRVFNAFQGRSTLPARIDTSLVRPDGTPLLGFGGTASGPEPLLRLVDQLSSLLGSKVGDYLTDADLVDCGNFIGCCVAGGNIRRSAEIAFGEPSSQSFLDLKDPDVSKAEMDSHRWSSNNSVFATLGMDYKGPAAVTAKKGEPGYEWLELARAYSRLVDPPDWKDAELMGTNPCVEQGLFDRELCNLVENFPARQNNYDELRATLKMTYLFAKTVSLVPTHDERTNAVIARNRRIGSSLSGIISAMQKFGRRCFLEEYCNQGYRYIEALDATYSAWLGVARSIKRTSVKPSGTVSLLPGIDDPGIHFPVGGRFYFRTQRFSNSSPYLAQFLTAGYRVEQDVADPSSKVVYFPVKARYCDRAESEVSMWEQLMNAAALQKWWADNQVSCTVKFRPEEAKDIPRALSAFEGQLKGISFLPMEHGYAQAPYIPITEEVYEAEVAKLLPLNLADLGQDGEVDRFCDTDSCQVIRKQA